MAYKNHWLRRAAIDFDNIYQYYRQAAGEGVAKRRLAKILQATESIEFMPLIGPIDNEFPHTPSYRYLVVMDYRIYYFVEEPNVYIAAIWDCRQGGNVFEKQ